MYHDSLSAAQRKYLILTEYKFRYEIPVLWNDMFKKLIEYDFDFICHEAYAYFRNEHDLTAICIIR